MNSAPFLMRLFTQPYFRQSRLPSSAEEQKMFKIQGWWDAGLNKWTKLLANLE